MTRRNAYNVPKLRKSILLNVMYTVIPFIKMLYKYVF